MPFWILDFGLEIFIWVIDSVNLSVTIIFQIGITLYTNRKNNRNQNPDLRILTSGLC
jgi:hypothetical protein